MPNLGGASAVRVALHRYGVLQQPLLQGLERLLQLLGAIPDMEPIRPIVRHDRELSLRVRHSYMQYRGLLRGPRQRPRPQSDQVRHSDHVYQLGPDQAA